MDIKETTRVWHGHDYLWWTGQVAAFLLSLSLLSAGHGGPISAAVGYALALLVDIREAVARRA